MCDVKTALMRLFSRVSLLDILRDYYYELEFRELFGSHLVRRPTTALIVFADSHPCVQQLQRALNA